MVALPENGKRHQKILDLLLDGEGLLGLKESSPSDGHTDLSATSIWFVKLGLVRRYQEGCGRSFLVDVHGPGSVASGFATIGRVEALRADPGTRLVELPLTDLARIGRRRPEALVTIVAALARHQNTLRSRLQLGGGGGERLAGLLVLLAGEVGRPCEHVGGGWIDLPSFTHLDLANLLSTTRPYVTGLLCQLIADGYLRRHEPRGLCVSPLCGSSSKLQHASRIDSSVAGA